MKKIIVVLLVLLLVSSLLFAGDKEEEIEKKPLEIIAIIFFGILFIAAAPIFFRVLICGGRTDAGALRLKENATLELKLRELLDDEEDEIHLKFIIKKTIYDVIWDCNIITIGCRIFRGTKKILTRTIKIENSKKVTKRIKKKLTFPIDITISSSPNNPDEFEIEVQRIISENFNNSQHLIAASIYPNMENYMDY